ncbi:DMT family transporter [archaeon]
MKKHLTKGAKAAVLAPLLFVGVSITLNLFSPGTSLAALHFLRPFVSALLLLPFVAFTDPKTLKPTKGDIPIYLAVGFALAASMAAFNTAMISAPVGTMTLLSNSVIFMVIGLSYMFLKEKVTRREVIACAIAFVGLVIINPLEPTHAFGTVLILASALTYAIAIIIIRKEERDHSIGIAFWYLLFASAFLFPFAATAGFGGLENSIGLVVLLGAFNGFAYLTKTYALKYETVDLVQVIALVASPITAIIFGFILLGQSLTANVLIGGAIMMAAGLVISKELFT